ncbi:MAG: hypothetical protein GYA23_02950 [Methanomicrobiales archaeon]|nr:hypothetical protein [Methanomicrobiales archaeon]
MRMAFIAFALAIGLFALVKFQPPLLYATLLFPAAVMVYGLLAEEPPVPPKKDDEDPEPADQPEK